MNNPIYNMYGQNDLITKFNQFKKNFTGDPRQQIQQMLNSGRISQAQYNQAVQKTNDLMKLFGKNVF